ncbi:methenyltetrahydromethanopterin cyclohydrolase [Roseiconus lacunae]|uniref:methenyltetrahydromethanopterin cyclohydrolase n=1 Tax=Roseiconus lacunae TaxID=2605694 RepID=UPI0011F1D97D|nr:methenyltetrahydromethanopterin cyclohydrolase [Roseiconus lacunae]WRQ49837.1 methenyltetrahydromethanopterin cyclohydrolase [Stieleria sp. HD01]
MRLSPNQNAIGVIERLAADPVSGVTVREIGDANVYDFGVKVDGTLAGGLALAEICLGGLGRVSLVPCDGQRFVSANSIYVQTDAPLVACLGCQYAGWPVQADDYFAMGSGPARLHRGREAMLQKYDLGDSESKSAVVVLEAESFPTESTIALIAEQCGVQAKQLRVCIAPSTSIAGSAQVVARSIETALHKIDELGFDVRRIVSGTGCAPLPPPAKRGDMIGGIGRTNDAMLYGAEVTLYVNCDDEAVESIYEKIPSCSSSDYGRPFAKIFADYDHDFYKVDPMLFSPAVVTVCNLKSGRTFRAGKFLTDVLRESFLS